MSLWADRPKCLNRMFKIVLGHQCLNRSQNSLRSPMPKQDSQNSLRSSMPKQDSQNSLRSPMPKQDSQNSLRSPIPVWLITFSYLKKEFKGLVNTPSLTFHVSSSTHRAAQHVSMLMMSLWIGLPVCNSETIIVSHSGYHSWK
jgi:hypothetical protein